jgi:hypothetical protein
MVFLNSLQKLDFIVQWGRKINHKLNKKTTPENQGRAALVN